MSSFHNFHENPPTTMPIFDLKNLNFVKTTLYYGPKKSIGCSQFFIKKSTALMPIFCQQNIHSLKKTLHSCSYFDTKTSILSITQCSRIILSNFSWKTPCFFAYIWSKTVKSFKTTLYYGPKKANSMVFFPILHEILLLAPALISQLILKIDR